MRQFCLSFRLLAPFCALIVVWFSAPGCERFCTNTTFTYSTDWTAKHLDNSGSTPAVAAGDIPLSAYGFRVENPIVLSAVADNNCDYYYGLNPVLKLQIFTNRPFDGLPAQSNVTDKFNIRLAPGDNYGNEHTTYISVNDGLYYFNSPDSKHLQPFYVDFLLIDKPATPDSCAWTIHLEFNDSTVVNIHTSTIFLK